MLRVDQRDMGGCTGTNNLGGNGLRKAGGIEPDRLDIDKLALAGADGMTNEDAGKLYVAGVVDGHGGGITRWWDTAVGLQVHPSRPNDGGKGKAVVLLATSPPPEDVAAQRNPMPRPRPEKRGGKPDKNHRRRLRNMITAPEYAVYEPPNKDQLQIARVYVNYGVESGVELNGELKRVLNRRNLPTVAGDLVYTDGNIVEGILPRGKVLARYADEGGVRLIASHLDQVGLVVSASKPPIHEGFLDRYLVYCRIVELPLFIVLNKMDEADPGAVERLKPYTDAGVDLYTTSAEKGLGLKALARRLERGITVLSGLSGVGKSTLINALIDEEIPTQEISLATGRGRHTTTASEVYEFGKTLLIDTPGIKKFGFIGVDQSDIVRGFPEFEPFLGQCAYDDCTHMHEDGCAIIAAVEEGLIDERRWQSYGDIIESLGADPR